MTTSAELPYFLRQSRRGQQVEFDGLACRLGARAATQLGEDVPHVHVDGARTEKELACDLSVGPAVRDQTHHLELPSAQPGTVERGGRLAPESALHRLAQVRQSLCGLRGQRSRA